MKLGTLSKNHIVGLILFLECGLIFCFVWFYAMPTQKKIEEIKTVIVEKQRQVREIENTKRQLAETKIEIEKLKIDINRLEKFTREEVYIPRTLVLLEKLAESTRMTIMRIAPSSEAAGPKKLGPAKGETPSPAAAQPATPPRPGTAADQTAKNFNEKNEFRTSTIDMEFAGEFRAMYSFMGELASFPKLVVVEKIDITRNTQDTSKLSPQAQGAQTNRLQIKMPMTFYIQKKASLVPVKGSKEEQKDTTEGEQPGDATR